MSGKEFNAKHEIADRLNILLNKDPLLVSMLLRTNYTVNPRVADTQTVCLARDNLVTTNFLGIVDGLVGDNEYVIVPKYKDGRLIGFAVESMLKDLITVNSTKEIGVQDED